MYQILSFVADTGTWHIQSTPSYAGTEHLTSGDQAIPYTLVIGNQNYSSWSFRPWLAMRVFDIAFEAIKVELKFDGNGPTNTHILEHSPAKKVPVLKDGDITIWDTMAIFEYLAERHLDKALWPSEKADRAQARSIAAEMHSGFAVLRHECPMNMRRAVSTHAITDDARRDVARICAIWREALTKSGGSFLYGDFSLADAAYAPVVNRLHVYRIAVDQICADYMARMMALPDWQEWEADSRAETWVIPEEDF